MIKLSSRQTLLKTLVILSALSAYSASAQDHDVFGEDLFREELAAEELSLETGEFPEAAPKPEPPYPGSDEEGFAAKPAATADEPPPPLANERPKRINDEGQYYFDTKLEKPIPSPAPGIEAPIKTNEAGEYFYSDKKPLSTDSNRHHGEKPMRISADGQYYYPVERSPMNASASVRLGFLTPPTARNPESGLTFKDIYGDKNLPVLFGDYEWRLTSRFGRLGLKLATGLAVTQGQGRFESPDPQRRADDIPDEQFTFFMLPNQLTAIYRFQYSDTQIFVPFVEGGAGYFTFAEMRDDNKPARFGGAAVTVAAGGFHFLLDWLDRRSIYALDNDYGINHLWLTAEYRLLVGINQEFDWTSNVINAGITVDF